MIREPWTTRGIGKRPRPQSKVWAAVLLLGCLLAAAPVSAADKIELVPLDASDLELAQAQRERVTELARRHVGPPPTGALSDLELLQRLVDSKVVEADATYDLQAMGVVLGDVMVKHLPLEWVVVIDAYGRSRALRYRNTDNVFFPVTMISKRVERDAPVDVRALYDKVQSSVKELEQSSRRRG